MAQPPPEVEDRPGRNEADAGHRERGQLGDRVADGQKRGTPDEVDGGKCEDQLPLNSVPHHLSNATISKTCPASAAEGGSPFSKRLLTAASADGSKIPCLMRRAGSKAAS